MNAHDVDTATLRATLIEHFSREIEVHTNSIATFRSRIHLSVFFGTYVLLGAYLIASKGIPAEIDRGFGLWLAVAVLTICFVVLATIGGRFERHIWNQCNVWRESILAVRCANAIPAAAFQFRHKVVRAYLVSFLVLLLSFIAAIMVLVQLPSQVSSPAGG